MKKVVITDEEFLRIINKIINNEEYIKRKDYKHHEDESVYEHSLKVAYMSYNYAKKHKLNVNNIVIGALLNDFYYKPWQDDHEKKKFLKQHGFVHASEALENSKKFFPEYMNPMIEDIILRHMFPLNIKPPKYKESYVVCLMDKYFSLNVLKHPSSYPKYLGIKRRKRKESK